MATAKRCCTLAAGSGGGLWRRALRGRPKVPARPIRGTMAFCINAAQQREDMMNVVAAEGPEGPEGRSVDNSPPPLPPFECLSSRIYASPTHHLARPQCNKGRFVSGMYAPLIKHVCVSVVGARPRVHVMVYVCECVRVCAI